MSHSSSSTLQDLPHELLEKVVSHFNTAQSLRSLCLVSKRLNEYIQNDGFRAFVHHRFPSISTPPHWADAAHALTTLSRAWDHKALLAYYIKPNPSQSRKADHGPSATRRSQTMGYQPVIDCFESWTGDDWSSRKEILACGTGADLTVRFKQKGSEAERRWREMRRYQRCPSGFDGHHHQIEWSVLKETELFDGRDDITSVNLLRDHQKPSSQSEYAVVGRASGGLSTMSMTQSQTGIKWGKENRFKTNGSSVKFATISLSPEPLLAVCLGNETVCLYQVASATELTKSFGEAAVEKPTPSARIRSTRFLRQDLLAVGLGPCTEFIQIFNIRPDSVPKLPLRKFSASDEAQRLNEQGQTGNIYSIAPLASSFAAGGAEGDLFLSGGYDGAVR
ncbi:MAG: hypothetical protein Q9214_000724 [Letrouitia sp. 1 TL-2023]